MYKKRLCIFCGDSLKDRIVFNNFSTKSFVLMKENQSCHLECYINELIILQAKVCGEIRDDEGR